MLISALRSDVPKTPTGEKDHTNVDRAAWISTFEEALAKTIVHIVLSRQAEQTSQAGGAPKE